MIRTAQLLLVLAASGLWLASRLTWVGLRSFDGLGPPRTTTLSGATWSNGLVPFAVLLLAAAVAVLAVRGWPLRLLAVLVAAVSAGSGYLAITMWTTRDVAVRAASLADVRVASLVDSWRQYGGPTVTLAAAAATLLAAVLVMRVAVKRAPDSAGAERYVSPGRRRESAADVDPEAPVSERKFWDALDEGDDPTGDSGSEGR